MQKISPVCSNTLVGDDPHEWIPRTFEDFLKELDHIINSCEAETPHFRGHADSKWLLESTFVRTCKKLLLDIEPHIRPNKEIRDSAEYHQALFALFLLKYDVLIKADPKFNEYKILESTHNIDALHDLIKYYQQYPEKDIFPPKGTFFLDWSQKGPEVGIFFANFDSDEHRIKNRKTNGALFICDQKATGKTLMKRENDEAIRVEEIIELMRQKNNSDNQEGFGCPLHFYPPTQKHIRKANNQDVIYWAQMDLRHDLEYMWSLQEKASGKDQYIFMKLILPYESRNECAKYLKAQKITHSYLFAK